MDSDGDIILKDMEEQDCRLIAEVFSKEEHSTPIKLYQSYFQQKKSDIRDIIIAWHKGQVIGYVTIVWESNYEDFKEQHIPEIKDIRVLPEYQRQGIASRLMDEAEKRVAEFGAYCAAGVGLSETYAAAQSLYAKRGYVPDGKGIFYMDQDILNDQLEVDDNQGLMMIKRL